MNDFKARIKQLRIEQGLNYSQLASIFNKTEGAIRAWESGRTKPDADTLIKISNYFEVSVDYLLGLRNTRNAENEAIVADLGLTEECIENIKKCVHTQIDINRFISSPLFFELVRYLTIYWHIYDDDKELWENPPAWMNVEFLKGVGKEVKLRYIKGDIQNIIERIWEDNRGPHKATPGDWDAF